jgi:hypothetical protein
MQATHRPYPGVAVEGSHANVDELRVLRMPDFISDTPLARDLIRIGDEAIARKDDAALRAYFAEDYVFHGPGGRSGLR